jgi:hypothetical protein
MGAPPCIWTFLSSLGECEIFTILLPTGGLVRLRQAGSHKDIQPEDLMAGNSQASRFNPKRNIVPDRLDLRDCPYLPSVAVAPPAAMTPRLRLPVLYQGNTNACTGFALANVVNFLTRLHDPKATILLLSGCQDNQLSHDGAFNGLFTSQLLKVWKNGLF